VSDVVGVIVERMRARGRRAYLGESVSITDHMLQTAVLAEQDAALPALVAAALLHDVAYVVTDLLAAGPATGDLDERHAEVGAAFLAAHFVPAVVEPVRLHVAAKRYLCAVEPGYLASLSPASLRTLGLQGGPYGDAEARAFAASPYAADAVRLRRYDERAKVAGGATPDLDHYQPLLRSVLR